MDTCRICLFPAPQQVVPLSLTFNNRTIAEMVRFCSGIEVSTDDFLPQAVCSECWPQIIAAVKLKEICIDSDNTLRSSWLVRTEDKDELPVPLTEPRVKIETEPDLFHVETLSNTVKDEPIDELEEFCSADAIDYDYLKFEDPMRSVRRYSSEERSYPTERKVRYKPPSTSRMKREPPPTSFKCYLCNEEFNLRKLKYEHLESVHSNDEFKCRVCKHKSQTARGMDNHVMLHENPELLSHMCHICSKNYQKACELRRHIKLSHSDKSQRVSKFFCDCCDFKTFSKMNVKRHLRTIHLKIKAFQCQFCPDKKYTSKVTLDQHMITKHGQETDYVCRCCGRKFPTMSFLRSHMKSTCSGSPGAVRERGDPNEYREQLGASDHYRCKICLVIVEGKGKISQHYAQRHKHSNACELCSATFNSYSNLKKHIQILHNKIHKFECSFCGKRFGQRNQLQSHENTHTGAKPFGCKFELCQFRSGDLSAVSKHQKKCSHNPMNMTLISPSYETKHEHQYSN